MSAYVEAVGWGLLATVPLTAILSGSQVLGWTRMSLPLMVGSIVTGHRATALVAGTVLHFVLGCVFALLYALVFEELGRATAGLGALLGLYHGAFVLTVLVEHLPDVHPRMAGDHHGPDPTRLLQPPGFLALHYGTQTPLFTLIAHVVYGAVLGAGYAPG